MDEAKLKALEDRPVATEQNVGLLEEQLTIKMDDMLERNWECQAISQARQKTGIRRVRPWKHM